MKIPSLIACAACGLALLSGCSKKESGASALPNQAASASAVDQAAQPAATKPPPSTDVLPDASKAALSDAQAAMQAKNYDKAAQLMLNLQKPAQQSLTPQQAAALANQMRQFQRDLGSAVASGDPAAIAAAQRFRAASRLR